MPMDEVLEEFESDVEELRSTLRAGSLSGTDGERAKDQAEQLVRDYRAQLEAEERPSHGRELLERFRQEVARL